MHFDIKYDGFLPTTTSEFFQWLIKNDSLTASKIEGKKWSYDLLYILPFYFFGNKYKGC